MSSVISAVSTPFGKGGIAVIRISGTDAIEVASTIFKPANGKSLTQVAANTAVYGSILYEGKEIDDGIATVFRGPASFTGEDTVELSCHGGIMLTEQVLRSTYLAGAQPAEAGEFTKRAFCNGKLSLSEAEAVIDLIDAETTEQIKLAHSHAKGVLAREIEEIRALVLSLLSEVYVFIDYPDEDLSDVSSNEALEKTYEVRRRISKLCSTYDQGKAVRQGIPTVICGKPNTGKSSLLNALSGTQRAIVTSVAGTTRDTVEERVNLGKIILALCDTAGIHETRDEVELLGIDRSIEKIESADLSLLVIDASKPLDQDDMTVIEKQDPNKTVVILNKSDLGALLSKEDFPTFKFAISVSCETGEGIDQLREMIESLFIKEDIDYNSGAVIANHRQFAALLRANEAVERALATLNAGHTPDVAGMELELALSALSEVDSRTVSEDIVNTIFSRFCIGK